MNLISFTKNLTVENIFVMELGRNTFVLTTSICTISISATHVVCGSKITMLGPLTIVGTSVRL